MTNYGKAVTSVAADIRQQDSGGFTAIASNGDLDRDNERIMPGCFAPLPKSIPVHVDHTMRAASVVARARPYYVLDDLMIEATFSSTPDAQEVRQKVADGTLDSLSIMFTGNRWEDIAGVRTCVSGELLAADIVSVPSNRGARILSSRSYSRSHGAQARDVAFDAMLLLARVEIADAERVLDQHTTRSARASVRRFLRSL